MRHTPIVIARLDRAIQYCRGVSDRTEKPRRTGCPLGSRHKCNTCYGPEGLLASPAAAPQTKTRAPPAPRRQPRRLYQTGCSITERPTEVEGRGTAGHSEADFYAIRSMWPRVVWFPTNENPLQHRLLSGSIEKLSSPPELSLVNSGNSPKAIRKTISFDNGNEFAEHHRLHKTIGLQTFFCDPHSPWQKGGVENSNRPFPASPPPRKTDLNLITEPALKWHVQRLNDTPRKRLDSKTPARHSPKNRNQSLHFKRDFIPRLRGYDGCWWRSSSRFFASLRGAKRRSNPFFLLHGAMDCFAEPVIGHAFARDPARSNQAEEVGTRTVDSDHLLALRFHAFLV